MTERTSGGGDSPTNPMPPLLAAVREALTESIRERGVICPVVKDQNGYVLDGHNRIAVAAKLGVPCPEVVYDCDPDQRDIVRVELNGARRQMVDDEWKPLVDHLRAQVGAVGVRRFSDRVIARAVGVDRHLVQRHKSPESVVGPTGPTTPKITFEDGQVRHFDSQWTAISRILHLIRQSAAGLTVPDLLNDEVLREFSEATVRHKPGDLRDQGLIRPAGTRNRSTIWEAVPDNERTGPVEKPEVSRKAERVLDLIGDPEVRDEVRSQMAGLKEARQAEAVLRAAEKELEAATLAQDKREADQEREHLRLIEIARDQADKSVKAWDKLMAEVRAARTLLAAYSQVFDDLPAIHPAFCRMLDRELVELRQQMDWFDNKLHPIDARSLHRGTVIDV